MRVEPWAGPWQPSKMFTITAMGMSTVEVLPLLLLFVAIGCAVGCLFRRAQRCAAVAGVGSPGRAVAWGDFDAIEQPVGGVQGN
ncbi:hypothetical protein [Candidatus Amarobacter glycogenicus]|uniref:hypothetical protein n=1 Tax=Candidatus Amarobacter glycogenicus TaxID=3140699 RepID=UPI002A0FDA97|nr:hypothetical protein [Dehalococcoidia bacterium]